MSMVEMKVSELKGAALDWAVLEAIGGEIDWELSHSGKVFGTWGDLAMPERFNPSDDWNQGGPLIEAHEVEVQPRLCGLWGGTATCSEGWPRRETGKTPLVAACRAIVAAKLGGAVQIPSELAGVQS